MDICCPRCGELCDLYELHYSVFHAGCNTEEMREGAYKLAKAAFYDPARGCGVVLDGKPCTARSTKQGERARLLHDIFGEDIDGIASLTEKD